MLDPNVLVSAAISERGAPREILRRWAAGAFELVVSATLLLELREVLTGRKFRRYITPDEAQDFLLLLHDDAVEISLGSPEYDVAGVTPDPGDDYLAGVALEGRADVLVSGDRHLFDLPDKRIFDGRSGHVVRVLTPREFLGELDRGSP